MPQQPALAVQAGTVAPQAAVRGDDPVAGDDEGDGIDGVGLAHGPGGLGAPYPAGQFAVGDGLPPGNAPQFLPDPELKGGALGVQGEGGKIGGGAIEVGDEFSFGGLDERLQVRRGRVLLRRQRGAFPGKLQGGEAPVRKGELERPHRCLRQKNHPFFGRVAAIFFSFLSS